MAPPIYEVISEKRYHQLKSMVMVIIVILMVKNSFNVVNYVRVVIDPNRTIELYILALISIGALIAILWIVSAITLLMTMSKRAETPVVVLVILQCIVLAAKVRFEDYPLVDYPLSS